MMRRALPYLAPAPLLLGLFAPILPHPGSSLPTSYGGDLVHRFSPLRDFAFSQLRSGHLALWDPRILGGVPNLGGIESAMLYPPNWLHLVLPLGAAFNTLLFAHLWLAGALAALFARRLGASRGGAALAAVAWPLGGTLFPHLFAGHMTILCSLAWAPLVYTGIEAWLASRDLRWLAAGACASSLQLLAGSPQTAYYTMLGASLYATLRSAPQRRFQPLVGVAAMFALAGLLCAAQILPAVEAARESARAAADYSFSASFSLPPENLLTMLVPYWLGGGTCPYFGRLYLPEACLFCGAAAFLLAGACPRPKRLALWGGAAGLGLLALGAHTPLHRLLWTVLPGFAAFRGPSKFSSQAMLLFVAAAALGYDAVATPQTRRRLLWSAAGLSAAFALSTAVPTLEPGAWTSFLEPILRSSESFVPPILRSGPSFAAAVARAAAISFAVSALDLLAAAGALQLGLPEAMLALTFLDAFLFARLQVGVAPVCPTVPQPLAQALASDPGEYRFLSHWPNHPNLGLIANRKEVWGYDQLVTRRWAELAAWTQGADPRGAGLYQLVERFTPRTPLLRARYLLREDPPRIERDKGDLPWAFLACPRAVGAGAALAEMSRPDFDLRRDAAVEAPPSALPRRFAGGEVEVSAKNSDELDIRARAPEGGLVVITDAYSAGWRAEAAAPKRAGYQVYPADHGLLGVPVGPGSHHFRLVYEPRTWKPGILLTGLGLAALTALYAPRRRRRRPW